MIAATATTRDETPLHSDLVGPDGGRSECRGRLRRPTGSVDPHAPRRPGGRTGPRHRHRWRCAGCGAVVVMHGTAVVLDTSRPATWSGPVNS